jgi:hypothetical protein
VTGEELVRGLAEKLAGAQAERDELRAEVERLMAEVAMWEHRDGCDAYESGGYICAECDRLEAAAGRGGRWRVSEYNEARERLMAWIRDFGKEKEPIFIADIQGIMAEVERLMAEVKVTRDAVRLVIGRSTAVSWKTVQDADVDSYISFLQRQTAEKNRE